MITIRRAEIKDIPTIMQFLEDHWLHGYVLAHDRKFFDWQFVHDGKVNIWIGIDDETGKLYAILSMIIYRDVPNPDVSGSVWLAIKSPNPMLAFDLQDFMWQELQPRDTFSPGLRPDAVKVNELLGYPVVAMDHYYRLADRKEYQIAVVNDILIPDTKDTGFNLTPCSSLDEFRFVIPEELLMAGAPSKDYGYIKWRYFDHPLFHYDLWKITNPEEHAEGILITREEHANGSSCCKIVDFYGDSSLLGKITHSLDNLIKERGYEFADIYSYGVSTEIYEKGGLVKCDTSSANIITNFFQPFTPVNSDIMLVPPGIPNARIFRGDSDQDKPRLTL